LIVDDHETFRVAARELLAAAGFVVVGEAGDGPGALAEVARLVPDVVLLDVQLPGLDGSPSPIGSPSGSRRRRSC
jgi:DNA-binding NarL/FixJ family response regulator